MPVFNCENYIFEAVDSILSQTFSNFELIIIDDCSTDLTLKIVKSFEDKRIILVQKEENTGYTDSLNYGISIAKGKYVARMDGDDISLPYRFEKQYAFLENNADVIICGTAIQIIGTQNIERHPENHNDLQVKLCFSSVFHHPTVMVRTSVIKHHFYNKEFEPAEDYELWTRLAFIGKMANLEDVLLYYRMYASQTSSVRKKSQDQNIFKCQMIMFNKFLIGQEFTINQLKTTLAKNDLKTKETILTSIKIYNHVIKYNAEIEIFNQNALENTLYNKQLFLFRDYLKNNIHSINALLFVLNSQGLKGFLRIISPMKIIKNEIKLIINKSKS